MSVNAPAANPLDIALPLTPEQVDDPKAFQEFMIVYRALRSLQVAIAASVTLNTGAVPYITREILQAARTYYVSTAGSNSNNGLSVATPFLTIQHAINVVGAVDISIYAVTIQLADGTYTESITTKAPLGTGVIYIIGNVGTPANVVITTASLNGLTHSQPFTYYIMGVKFVGTGTAQSSLQTTHQAAVLLFNNVEFGTGWTLGHIYSGSGAIKCQGPGSYKISGGSQYHIIVNDGLCIAQANVTLVGTPNFSAYYVTIQGPSIAYLNTSTFTGTATGVRFYIDSGGQLFIDVGEIIPGSIDGIYGTELVGTATPGTFEAIPINQADSRYAAIAGLGSQVFSAANATPATQEVLPISQADTRYPQLALTYSQSMGPVNGVGVSGFIFNGASGSETIGASSYNAIKGFNTSGVVTDASLWQNDSAGNIAFYVKNIATNTWNKIATVNQLGGMSILQGGLTAVGAVTGSNLSGTNTGDNAANSSTTYVGTTAIALNRASAAQVLTGITSIDGNAATVTNGEYATNKDASGGYVGLTLMAINFWNSAKTFMSNFTNANTAARTYTFQDRNGTIADHTDTLAAFAAGGAIAPASINGVTTDSTTNKPVTAASLNGGTLPISGTYIAANSSSGALDCLTLKNTASYSVGGGAGYSAIADNGTGMTSGARLGYSLFGGAYDTSHTISYSCGIGAYAAEAWSSTAQGSYFGFLTTPTGSTTSARVERLRITASGNILIGSTTDDGVNKLQVTGSIKATTTIATGGYTVATLPAGTVGQRAYVTDALAPTWNGALTGGGAVVVPVFRNATGWVSV